ncbi:MAG: universal stress protein [Pontixanthobacter sp.]
MRSILVHISDDACLEGRFQIALDLARSFDAHLIFLQAISENIAMPGDIYGTIATQMLPVVQEQADKLRHKLEQRLQHEDIRWNWVQEVGMADSRLIAHAALNDLVLVGALAPLGSELQPSRLAGALAIHGRTPVMVTPKDASAFDVAKPAIVAWNGSVQASHALRAATGLLCKAESVTLLCVTGEDGAADFDLTPSEGAEYLSRHEIACEVLEMPAQGRNPAEILLETASHRDAGYIVLGAYGHARLFEIMFGGVTRRILKNPPIPMVLAH